MWAFYTLVGVTFAVVLHALLCRSQLRGDSVAKFLVAGGSVGLCLAVTLGVGQSFSMRTWAGLLSYAFLCELYIFLFTLIGSSISASLLTRIRRGSLTRVEIDQLFGSKAAVEARLRRLTGTAFITDSPKGVILTRKGECLLAVFRTLRRFFRHSGVFGSSDFVRTGK